jgi:DNA-binding transcriptional ArsR family regulator
LPSVETDSYHLAQICRLETAGATETTGRTGWQTDGPLSAGEIVTRTGLSQPNASMHLACLAECGLVTWERQGTFVLYELADGRVVKLLDQAEDLLLDIGPLIEEACPRYSPSHAGGAARPQ